MKPRLALVAVAYNRIGSLARLLGSLERADYGGDEVTLIISVDRSDSDVVERYARDYRWPYGPKRVKTHAERMGLREHMLSQGREELDEFDAIAVLEDDIVVSPAFYSYAMQCIERYADVDAVAGISLYAFPLSNLTYRPFEPLKGEHDVYFMRIAQSWGEIWTRRAWRQFYAWYERNIDFGPHPDVPAPMFAWDRSWLKYHTRYCIETGRYFVYPYFAVSSNCGDTGTHSGARGGSAIFQTNMQTLPVTLRLPDSPAESVRYDAFFEYEGLHDLPGLGTEECRLDLNGFRGPDPERPYCLSCRPLPYAVVKSYGLVRRPPEANVLLGEPGEGLWLYDTRKKAPAPKGTPYPASSILYGYRIRDFLHLAREFGLRAMASEVKAFIKQKRHDL